jgi:hypothetical protein
MTKILAALAVVGTAAGTLATAFIWILLTQPTTMAAALETGDVRLLLAALTGTAQ